MNKKKLIKYSISTLLVCILIAAAVFLPQYYSKIQDGKYLYNIVLKDRDKISLSYNYDIPLEDKVKILTASSERGEELKPVLKSQENVVSRKKLIEAVKEEIKKLESVNLIPPYFSLYDLESGYQFSYLYSVNDGKASDSVDNNSKDVLFWNIKISDGFSYDISLCMDAYTYCIYGAYFSGEALYQQTALLDAEIQPDDLYSMIVNDMIYGIEKYYGASFVEAQEGGIEEGRYLMDIEDTKIVVKTMLTAGKYSMLGYPEFEIGLEPVINWMNSTRGHMEMNAELPPMEVSSELKGESALESYNMVP